MGLENAEGQKTEIVRVRYPPVKCKLEHELNRKADEEMILPQTQDNVSLPD